MSQSFFNPDKKLTRAQKNAQNKLWYKETLRSLDKIAFSRVGTFGYDTTSMNLSEFRKMKINYDLFNNVVNKSDFESVCYPFGKDVGQLPVDFTNKDIISGKVKALIGMEMKRPFSWKAVAVNEEATTRKEQAELKFLTDYVVSSIMQPIQEQIEMKYMQEQEGRELTPDEQEQIQQQIAQETEAMTPPEVKVYMERDHQDPAEILAHQILEYLIQSEDIKMKFNKGWKHGLIAGRPVFWVGAVGNKPKLKVINPLKFDYDRNPDNDYIEQGEWACHELNMTPSQIVQYFGDDLSQTEIDELYEEYSHATAMRNEDFTFRNDGVQAVMGIRVLHGEWKALKPIQFLHRMDEETGEMLLEIVDESYKLNIEAGDVKLETHWIVSKFEGYQIGRDKFALLREVPGQYKDMDNLYDCSLSYKGASFDDMNSETTSLVDRMKYYQYMYNVIQYKIENLIASDEGKSILLNGNIIPSSAGVKFEEWMYNWKVNKVGILDPTEEGNKGSTNIGEAAKEIDLSLVSDIQKYIELAMYIERRCGESVGITKEIEGQIENSAAVRNTQQAVVAAANILEPYFELFNNVKRNVLQALIDVAKVVYSETQPKNLSYIFDDMTLRMLSIDYDLLDNSTYGIFVSDSLKSNEALEMVKQLSHAALQNQRAELSDVIKVMKSESIQEAEELLKRAERERTELEQANSEREIQAKQEAEEKAREWEREKMGIEHKNKMEEIQLKGDLDIQKQTILSLGFNEDKDLDKDGVPDVLEVAKFGVDANIKQSKIDLEREKLAHAKEQDKIKNKQEDEKIAVNKAKANQIKSRASTN